MSIKNLSKNEVVNEQWTQEKYKLVELVADIPSDALDTILYLYCFIGCGMLNGKFTMSKGHEKDLETFLNRAE